MEKAFRRRNESKTERIPGTVSERHTLKQIASEAFALVREAAKRTLGYGQYDVQLIGGLALHDGLIAEMKTGEEKPWCPRHRRT